MLILLNGCQKVFAEILQHRVWMLEQHTLLRDAIKHSPAATRKAPKNVNVNVPAHGLQPEREGEGEGGGHKADIKPKCHFQL